MKSFKVDTSYILASSVLYPVDVSETSKHPMDVEERDRKVLYAKHNLSLMGIVAQTVWRLKAAKRREDVVAACAYYEEQRAQWGTAIDAVPLKTLDTESAHRYKEWRKERMLTPEQLAAFIDSEFSTESVDALCRTLVDRVF